jgi:hypothetical protein
MNGRRMEGRILTVNEATPLTASATFVGTRKGGSVQNPA